MSRIRRLSTVLVLSVALAPFRLLPSPADAQSLRHDTGLPIEITADTLDVLQEDKVATFSGNVDAVQGEIVLSADQLRVHYRSGDRAAEEEPPAVDGSSDTIRRIEAVGNVFLTSPQETAQGEIGVYDVVSNLITLEGSVVLTRDDNVIRGQRLEMDLATGRSKVLAAVPSSEGGAPPERVRAIFTPASGSGADRGGGPGGPAEEGAQSPRPEAAAPSARAPVPPGPKPAGTD